MEKHKAHYDLRAIQLLVRQKGIDTFTRAAKSGVESMMLTEDDALEVVAGLRPDMLYKSMTTRTDHRLWQDVYHAPCPNGKMAYIKLTMHAGSVVIQFKEK